MADPLRHMTLAEAKTRLLELSNIPFRKLIDRIPEDAVRAKGRFGSFLEDRIGLNPFSASQDFLDGELKTNQTRANGDPDQPICICQIGSLLDGAGGLLAPIPMPFDLTKLHKKTANVLIVPVVKVDLPPEDWYIGRPYHINSETGTGLFEIFREDYEHICKGMRKDLESSPTALIQTTNGPHYIQIRTKDGNKNRYKPMFSAFFERPISSKRYAFYFRTNLVKDLRSGILREAT